MTSIKDVVILLPGITGSVLVNAAGAEVWAPTAATAWRAITSLGRSITDLELPASGDASGVTATRLVPDLTVVPRLIKIDGYSRTETYLASLGLEPGANYFPFPYDWRLDCRVNAERLQSSALHWLKAWRESSGLKDARLVLVAHSLGGLVARQFLECLGGWQHTRTLITIGTPYQGSLNAVDFLVHGMKKGIGPLGLDLSPLLRSCPSVYQLLPIYHCIATGADTVGVAAAAHSDLLPNIDLARVEQALQFHRDIAAAQDSNSKNEEYVRNGYRIVPIVGIEQPTFQSAQCAAGEVRLLRSLGDIDDGGDGTVPRIAATPIELEGAHCEVYAADMHGSLQVEAGILANIRGQLIEPTRPIRDVRAPGLTALSLDVNDVVLSDEELVVQVTGRPGHVPTVVLTNRSTGEVSSEQLSRTQLQGLYCGQFKPNPGTWEVTVSALGCSSVTDLVVVAEV